MQTQLEVRQEFRNCIDATVTFQNKKLEDLNHALAKLYSQEVGATDKEAKEWALHSLEKAGEFNKEMEGIEETRKQYNEELSKNIIAKVYTLFDYIYKSTDT